MTASIAPRSIDAADTLGRLAVREVEVLGEERGEVEASHLGRRPPERLPVNDSGVTVMASQGGAKVGRTITCEQKRPQDWVERRRLDRDAGLGAIVSAATSACCVASPPCLTGKAVTSPTA